MMLCQAQQTSMSGGRARHLPAHFAAEGAPQNISSAAALKPWLVVAIAGTTTRRSKQSLKVESAIYNSKHHHAQMKVMPFIKAGEKTRVHLQKMVGLLHTAPD